MKHKIFKSFALVVMIFMGTLASWAVEKYCQKEMTSGSHTILVTGQKTGENAYQLLIESEEQMSGLGGSFMNVNGAGGYQLNAAGHYEVSADGKTITCNISSSTIPTHYTPLYVLMPGEVNFGQPDIDYSQTCTPKTITSEYCFHYTNDYPCLTWVTDDKGNVIITISDSETRKNVTFRNGAFEGSLDEGFSVLSGENFETSEPASTYFEKQWTDLTPVFYLNKKTGVTLPDPCKIKFTTKAMAWREGSNDKYCFPTFVYTYGGVCPMDYPVTGVSLNTKARTIETGSTYKLTATILPEYATNKNITWTSDNTNVATVNKGTVTPVAAGTTNIIVTTEDGGFKDTCVVTVIEKTSQCYGDLGHFATPTNAKMHYEIVYENGSATFTITGINAALDFGEIQTVEKGSYAMTADGNGGYTYTFNGMTAGDKLHFRFLYSDTSFGGNEQTSQNLTADDPNIRYYIVGDCLPPYKKASEDYTKLTGVSATASSTREAAHPVGHAIDNDESTFWMSQWDQDPQTYTVDLGKECVFNTVTVKFGDHRAGLYDILVSRDGENFSTLATNQAGVNNAESSTSVDITIARYVRLNLRTRPNGYGYDIKNIKVLFAENSVLTTLAISNAENFFKVGQNYTITVDARDQYNVAIDPGTVTYTVTPASMGTMIGNVFTPSARGEVEIKANVGEVVSNALSKYIVSGDNLALNNAMKDGEEWVGTYYNTDTPNKAVNGNDGDVWQGSVTNVNDPTTGQVYDAWFVVDLKAEYEIDLISIHFEGACSDAYHIDFSDDAQTWDTAYSFAKAMGINNHTDYITSFSESTARYIRFWSTKASTGWGMKIYEMQVFGSEATSTTKTVGVAVNDASMGSATVKQNNVEVTEAEVGSTVVFNAVANQGYEFLNWTKGGTVVSTDATYEVEIESNTSLQANFDKVYTQYCHTAITSTSGGNKKLYLTLSQVADSFQILYEGSAECQLLSMNNANFQINGVCTNIVFGEEKTCGQDVPFTKADGRVIFSNEGYGSAKIVFALADNKTWKDIYVWTHAIFFNTASGEVGYTAFPDRYDIAWNKSCSDDEAPEMTTPVAEALNATDVRLTLSATDNWEGAITYTISRTGVEDVTASGASGATVTKDITGLTTGTEYTFSVTAKDAAGNVCAAQECKVTPAGDVTAPSNVTITAMPLSDKMIRLTMYADDNLPGELLYNIAWAGGGVAQTTAERGTQVIYDVAGLTPSTEYVFTLTVKDAADNWSGAVNSTAVSTFDKNLALNQPATAGGDALAIASGNNGNLGDRWASGGGDMAKNWWAVDLGKVYDVKNIRITFEDACPTAYTLQSSNDGTNWAVIQAYNAEPKHGAQGANFWNEYPVEAQARYLKIVATATTFGNAYGMSFWEFEAYGTPAIDSIKPVVTTFTATGVSSSSVQLKAQATDNFCDSLVYVFSCEGVEKGSVKMANGEEASFTVTGLSMGTQYNFSVVAKDAALNESAEAQAQAEPITDTEAPQNVSATAGTITHESIELLLNATDNLGGDITYTISRTGAEDVVATGASGVEKSVVIEGLNYSTAYSFSVVAKDGSDNAADPVAVNATTTRPPYPLEAAIEPSFLSEDVKPVYSVKYGKTNCNWQLTSWGNNATRVDDTFGQKINFNTAGYIGIDNFNYSLAQTDHIYMQVWSDVDNTIDLYPIAHNEAETGNLPEKFVTVNLVGGEWNYVDVQMADFQYDYLGHIYQIKIANAINQVLWFNNILFYTKYEPVRTGLTEGAYGTFCSKKAISNYRGATFYQVDYIDKDERTLYFNEVESDSLVAGKAYLFKAADNQIQVVTYGDEIGEAISGDEARGFIGVFVDTPVPAPYTWYGIYGEKIQPVAQGVNILANRAYIDYANLKETTYVQQGQSIPRRLAFGTPKSAATELQNLYEIGQEGVQKIVVDGKVLILRNGQIYNAQGQLMK